MPTVFNLSAILTKASLSQAELARQAGVGVQTVNRLCNNTTAQVSLATLDKLATALGVEPGELIVRAKKGRKT
jgi:DNA-binding Xre family transcriptional regulator